MIEGRGGSDTLSGRGGNDGLLGGSGNDTVNGGDGNDNLRGNEGNDILKGGVGADLLFGEGDSSRDTLTGGDGKDKFLFDDLYVGEVSAAAELITDFKKGDDKIDLAAIHASEAGSTFTFVGTSAFSGGESGEVRYLFVTDDQGQQFTIIQGEMGDDRSPNVDFEIYLKGHVSLTADDFIL